MLQLACFFLALGPLSVLSVVFIADSLSPSSFSFFKTFIPLFGQLVFLGAYIAVRTNNPKSAWQLKAETKKYLKIYAWCTPITSLLFAHGSAGYSGIAAAHGLMLAFIPGVISGFVVYLILICASKKVVF